MIGLKMLQPRYLSVMQAETVSSYRDQVIRFGRGLGFETVSALAILDKSLTQTEFHGVDNTPPAYKDSFNDSETWARDPVMQHCKRTSVPIIWSQQTYVLAGQGSLWESQAQHGYKAGVALAIHMPEDKHFFIGVDRDRSIAERALRISRIVADLQLFAVHAQEAAFRIFAPPTCSDTESPHLTPRELETLRWTMDGKMAWEIGDILNISERTAVFHIQNAVRKLGCTSKHQAVLKAIRLRLLA